MSATFTLTLTQTPKIHGGHSDTDQKGECRGIPYLRDCSRCFLEPHG